MCEVLLRWELAIVGTTEGGSGLAEGIASVAERHKQAQGRASEARSHQQSAREQVREVVKGAVNTALERLLRDEVFALLGRDKGQGRDLADRSLVEVIRNDSGNFAWSWPQTGLMIRWLWRQHKPVIASARPACCPRPTRLIADRIDYRPESQWAHETRRQ